jgi:hypothetical protein
MIIGSKCINREVVEIIVILINHLEFHIIRFQIALMFIANKEVS